MVPPGPRDARPDDRLQHQTTDAQLRIGESRDSGFDARASPRNDGVSHWLRHVATFGDCPQASPDRRRVLDAAGVPELVEAARNMQVRFAADIALIDFAVIADMADDAHRPVLGQPEILAIGAL